MVVTPKAFVVVGADGVPQLVTLRDGKHGEVQKAIELGPNGRPVGQLPDGEK